VLLTGTLNAFDDLLRDGLVNALERLLGRVDSGLAGPHGSAEEAGLPCDGLTEHGDVV